MTDVDRRAVVFAEGGTPMEQVVGDLLVERGWKFAAAESCTGGLLAKRMTDAPGASRYFERGFVTYSNESKIEMLGVDPNVLQKQGAVSQTVAEQMAAGAAERAGVQVGVGITGVAGPDGGTAAKPVGTVFIAVMTPDGNAHANCASRHARRGSAAEHPGRVRHDATPDARPADRPSLG